MRLGAITATLAFLIPAASASAAQRFASPSGSGTACTQAAPCDVVTAVNSASNGDDVTIEPGTYNVSTTLDDGGLELAIHGQAGQPRPVIDSTAGYGIELMGGGSLSDVDVENSAPNAWGIYVALFPASIDHVVSHVTGSGAGACYPYGTITDSLCRADGTNGVGLTILIVANAYAIVRNDTVVAAGTGGVAVLDNAQNGETMEIDLRNTIARGALYDIEAETDSNAASRAKVTANDSNFATAHNGGGSGQINLPGTDDGTTNHSAAPQFVGNGDYRETAGSPTIDAGADSAENLSTDLDSNPRQLGAHTDIGAYEFVPPPTVPVTVGNEPPPKFSGVRERHGTFSFTLNEPAKVKLVVKRHGKKIGKLQVSGKAGKNNKHFSRRLQPGRYMVLLTASNAAGSASRKLSFTVRS